MCIFVLNTTIMKKILLVFAAALAFSMTVKAQVIGDQNVPQIVFGVGYSPAYTNTDKEEGYTDNVAPFINYQLAYEGKMIGVLARYGQSNFQRVRDESVNDYASHLFFLGASLCVNLGGSRLGFDLHVPGIGAEYRYTPQGSEFGICFYGSVRAHFFITRKMAIYAEAMGLISRMQNYIQPVAGIAIQL